MNRPDDEFDDFLARRKPIFSRAAENPLEPPDELDRLVLRQAREAIASEKPQRVFKGPGWAVPMSLAATVLLAVTVVLRVEMPTKASSDDVAVQTVAQRIDAAPATAAPAAMPDNLARAEAAPSTAEAQSTNSTLADRHAEPPRAQDKFEAQSRDRRAIVADTAGAAGGVSPGVPASSSPGGFVSEAEADRYAAPPPGASAARNATAPTAGVVVEDSVTGSRTVVTTIAPPPTEAERALAKANSTPAFRRDAKSWLAEIDKLRAEGKSAQADAEFAEYKRQYRAYAVSPDR